MKIAELFSHRFDSVEEDDEGKYALVCNECFTRIELPSPIDMISAEDDDPAHDYANEIIELIQRILKHLDECQTKKSPGE